MEKHEIEYELRGGYEISISNDEEIRVEDGNIQHRFGGGFNGEQWQEYTDTELGKSALAIEAAIQKNHNLISRDLEIAADVKALDLAVIKYCAEPEGVAEEFAEKYPELQAKGVEALQAAYRYMRELTAFARNPEEEIKEEDFNG